jgi:hypothetical protein
MTSTTASRVATGQQLGDLRIPPPSSSPQIPGVPDQISLIELVNRLLERRWFLARCTFWTGVLVGVITWAWPASNTVTVGFTPQSSGATSWTLSGLAGLAAQPGVSVPSLSGGGVPDLHMTLIEAPTFLLPIVESRYAFVDADGVAQDATYIDLHDIEGGTNAKTLDLLSVDGW